MTTTFAPWASTDIEEIRAFNARVSSSTYSFPTHASDLMEVGPPGSPLHHELFVARVDGTVRGGYALKFESFCTPDARTQVANLQIPLTEALIDNRYAALGAAIPRDALSRCKYIYCLGMGVGRPLPKLLQRLRWRMEYLPFYFRVVHTNRFLREIVFLRTRPQIALACDLARYTGIGALAVGAWNALHPTRSADVRNGLKLECVDAFDDRADELQLRVRREYAGFCDRSGAALNQRFPMKDARLVRLYVNQGSQLIGWLVLSRNQLHRHKQFGSMKLGCIVDGLCRPTHAQALIACATQALISYDVDLIVSNQSHRAWTNALHKNGYVAGPSNFALGTSPALTELAPALDTLHFNRGDGDGPINL